MFPKYNSEAEFLCLCFCRIEKRKKEKVTSIVREDRKKSRAANWYAIL